MSEIKAVILQPRGKNTAPKVQDQKALNMQAQANADYAAAVAASLEAQGVPLPDYEKGLVPAPPQPAQYYPPQAYYPPPQPGYPPQYPAQTAYAPQPAQVPQYQQPAPQYVPPQGQLPEPVQAPMPQPAPVEPPKTVSKGRSRKKADPQPELASVPPPGTPMAQPGSQDAIVPRPPRTRAEHNQEHNPTPQEYHDISDVFLGRTNEKVLSGIPRVQLDQFGRPMLPGQQMAPPQGYQYPGGQPPPGWMPQQPQYQQPPQFQAPIPIQYAMPEKVPAYIFQKDWGGYLDGSNFNVFKAGDVVEDITTIDQLMRGGAPIVPAASAQNLLECPHCHCRFPDNR